MQLSLLILVVDLALKYAANTTCKNICNRLVQYPLSDIRSLYLC